jgi:hypothetical protein
MKLVSHRTRSTSAVILVLTLFVTYSTSVTSQNPPAQKPTGVLRLRARACRPGNKRTFAKEVHLLKGTLEQNKPVLDGRTTPIVSRDCSIQNLAEVRR